MNEIDAPLDDQNQDLLARSDFANHLVAAIIGWKHNQSIIIGVYGPWGSGKTTTLNFIEQKINNISFEINEKPIIVKFNPWDYLNESQLLSGFLNELGNTFLTIDGEFNTKISKNLEEFWKSFQVFQEIPKIGFLVTIVAKLRGKPRTLSVIKKDLIADFKKLGKKIIVIIDDLDRLNDQEIRSLFQIIKNNADFPNTIYLLAFDREIVENALSNEQGSSGRKYLEKIIQVGFDLPVIEEDDLHGYLDLKIRELLSGENVSFAEDQLLSLYHNGFNDLFYTLRDVKRYLNGLSVTLTIIRGEVNPIDFLAVEALRVFIPDLYNKIPVNKDVFLNNGFADDETGRKTTSVRFIDILGIAGERLQPTKKLLSLLFPQLTSITGNNSFSIEFQHEWRKGLRLCSNRFFDYYFLLKVPRSSISQQEIRNLVKERRKNIIFFNHLLNFGEKLDLVLTRLPDNIDSQEMNAIHICDNLLFFSNQRFNFERKFLWIPPDEKAIHTIKRIISTLASNEVNNWLDKKTKTEKQIFGIMNLIRSISDNDTYSYPKIFSENQINSYKSNLVAMFRVLSRTGEFTRQKGFPSILYSWQQWDSESEELPKFIKRITTTEANFAEFVTNFISTSVTTSGNDGYITRRYVDFRRIENYFTKQEIENRIAKIIISNYKNINPKHKEGIILLNESIINPEKFSYN